MFSGIFFLVVFCLFILFVCLIGLGFWGVFLFVLGVCFAFFCELIPFSRQCSI